MRSNRSHTKSGPGRYHGQGALRIVNDKTRYVKKPQRRYPVAIYGGNWQGLKYLSYREYDMFKRAAYEGIYL